MRFMRIGQREALPGVFGNMGNRAFISGEQRPNFEGNRGTKTIFGSGNIRKQIFDFLGTGEHANLFQVNKGKGTPLGGLQQVLKFHAFIFQLSTSVFSYL